MENRKIEYRARDYFAAWIQTLFMNEEEIENFSKRIPGYRREIDICDHLAKQKYEQFKRDKKARFQNGRTQEEYRI